MATVLGWLRLVLLMISLQEGSCTYIANASFSPIVTVTELNWGLRTAYANCDLSFPLINLWAGSTFIFTRFNVRVLDFVHYVSTLPDAVQMHPSLKWLVVSADYNYNGVLNYGFQFNYGEFLGTGKPSGDCAVFTNLTEALEFGAAVPELTTTETDRFVSNASFQSVVVESSGGVWTSLAASCQAQLGDITLGLYEAYTYVDFGMPVYNAYSAYGTVIVDGEDGSSWVLGRYPTHGVGFINELYRFRVSSTADPLYANGYCSVYAVTNDTLPSLIGALHQSATTTSAAAITTTTTTTTTDTPTSTSTATTATGITTATSTTIATTVPLATTTPNSVTSTTSVPIPSMSTPAATPVSSTTSSSIGSTPTNGHAHIIMENFTESGLRRTIKESSQMRGQMVTGIDELWHLDDSNLLTCGRRCLDDAGCLSIFYSADTRRCLAHSSVYTKGDTMSNFTVYYVIV